MDTNVWQIPLFATIACLFPVLFISIFLGIRFKSLQGGLRLFFLFAILIVIYGLLMWGLLSLPDKIWQIITLPVFITSTVLICFSGLIYWLNAKRAGKIVSNGNNSRLNLTLVNGLLYLIMWLVFSFLFFYGRDTKGVLSAIPSLWALAVSLRLVKIFLSSFQIRENGFISRAKVVLFSDIEHAEWDNLLYKTKLNTRLKNTGRTISINIPGELITPIDNYVKTNFPRP